MRAIIASSFIVFAATACRSEPSASQESKAATSEVYMGDLDGFAQRVEDLVEAGDRKSLGGMWLSHADLDGCELEKPEKLTAVGIRDDYRRAFDKKIGRKLGSKYRGRVLFTNRSDRDAPTFGRSKLVGDDCKATRWGRVNVIVQPSRSPDKPIEHRFNALEIDGAWRLYRYLPNEPNCEVPAGRKHMGCKKLLELPKNERNHDPDNGKK